MLYFAEPEKLTKKKRRKLKSKAKRELNAG
jgi:hypothetical protein